MAHITKRQIFVRLAVILREFSEGNPEAIQRLMMYSRHNFIDGDATLADMNIGVDPIGHAELLDFRDKVEKEFGVSYADDELPDFFSAPEITIMEMVDDLYQRVSRGTAA